MNKGKISEANGFLYICVELYKTNMKKILVLSLILISSLGFGQDEGWLSFPGNSDSVTVEKAELDYTQNDGTVTIHEDERIKKIAAFVRAGEESLDGVLIDGYRVLIYFDQDKTSAEQQKARFMSIYNDHKTYIDYLAPNYRVRVGNFRTQLEADKLKQDLLGTYPTAVVVQDKIQLPELPEQGIEIGTGLNGGK